MGHYIANSIADRLEKGTRVLLLGLTFKENVPDLRNSKVIDVINGLRARDIKVDVHDPIADAAEARHEYGISLMEGLGNAAGYDALVGAVAHNDYSSFATQDFVRLVKPGGLVADIKGMWRGTLVPAGLGRWSL